MIILSFKFTVLLCTAVGLHFYTSLQISKAVNNTINVVIDELFHIPQGIAYCNGNFSSWDNKITTLPGLYYTSSILSSFNIECSPYNLRFINVLASTLNLIIFSILLKFIYINNGSAATVMLQALSLSVLPPLYFFSFVYYTDTLSLLVLLIFSFFSIVCKSKWLVLVTGGYSVLMRQTNVVWVAMMFGHKVLDLFIRSSRVYGNQYLNKAALKRSVIANTVDTSKLKRYYSLKDVFIALKYHAINNFRNVFQFLTILDYLVMFQQFLVLVGFVIFVVKNGSIVVGDKSAHQATIHIPQLFYFLIFYGVFALPHVLARFDSTLKLMLRNKLKYILITVLFLIIVHYNTLVHPYLLADNRHYMFYIWNRWYGKYEFAKYVTVPIYVTLLFSIYDNLKDQNCVSFLVPYTVALFLTLCLQKLVDIRYFLIPFIIIRLRFAKSSFNVAVVELLWYLIINAATFYVFFTKEIKWSEHEEMQRIIW